MIKNRYLSLYLTLKLTYEKSYQNFLSWKNLEFDCLGKLNLEKH